MKIPGSLYEKTIEEQRARTLALVALTGQDIPRVFHRQGNRIRDFRAAWDSACTAADLEARIAHAFRRPGGVRRWRTLASAIGSA